MLLLHFGERDQFREGLDGIALQVRSNGGLVVRTTEQTDRIVLLICVEQTVRDFHSGGFDDGLADLLLQLDLHCKRRKDCNEKVFKVLTHFAHHITSNYVRLRIIIFECKTHLHKNRLGIVGH